MDKYVSLEFLMFTTSMLPLLLFVVKLIMWGGIASVAWQAARLLRAMAASKEAEVRVYRAGAPHLHTRRRWVRK